MQQIVAYYRVSTSKQERSGLGLEGQQAAIEAFASKRDCELLEAYQEIETGKRADRPQLAQAIAHAKRARATLVVAKLDRLARNMAFLSALMDSGVDFVALDIEHANRLTVHIMAAVAEAEAKTISERTSRALQALKARGTKLGSAREGHWDGREHVRSKAQAKATKAAAVANEKLAADAYTDVAPLVKELHEAGKSYREIAAELNVKKKVTRRGKAWNPVQVMRVLSRS